MEAVIVNKQTLLEYVKKKEHCQRYLKVLKRICRREECFFRDEDRDIVTNISAGPGYSMDRVFWFALDGIVGDTAYFFFKGASK